MDKAEIKVSKNLISYLTKHKIYFKNLESDTTIFIPIDREIEEYSCFLNLKNSLYQIGSFSYSGSNLPYYVKVGRYCSIAPNVSAFGYQHPLDRISTASFTYEKNHRSINDASKERIGKKFPILENIDLENQEINIENDVWIGEGVLLKQGITLGNGSVIGQRSIATKDVPPYAIVAGSPARIIRYRFTEKIIERLLKLNWWAYHFADFHDINLNLDIEKYLDILEDKIYSGSIQEYKSKKLYFNDILDLSL